MHDPEPRTPEDLHPLAREILGRLRSRPEASVIILGGGVALQHYCPFRLTRDIDAWWQGASERETRELIEEVIGAVASTHGYTPRVRRWGETESYELQQGGKTVFSFQIAIRTTELEPPRISAWDPVKIETFRDNLAAKMNAVVARGAPRDFLDIFEVCRRKLVTAQECWRLWQRKNRDKNVRSAKANVGRHLEQLDARRPLESIQSDDERARAQRIRDWLKNDLCRELDRGDEPRR